MREREDYMASLERGVQGLRLALIPSLAEDVDDANTENFARALDVLRELGASIEKCEPLMGFEDWRSPQMGRRRVLVVHALRASLHRRGRRRCRAGPFHH